MSAWKHTSYWTPDTYESGFRKYVQWAASTYEGRTEDCADLSITLLIDFAETEGLPLTFSDLNGVRYISKTGQQVPHAFLRNEAWSTKAEFARAVTRRLNANALFLRNMVVNAQGPQPGDVMLKSDHAAVVFDTWPAGMPHPKEHLRNQPGGIPQFPGSDVAATQLNQTRYFRDDPTTQNASSPHIDYLNHRGVGQPTKQKAELLLYADVAEMLLQGFQFFRYGPAVLDNWATWSGVGDPPT